MNQEKLELGDEEYWNLRDSGHRCPSCGLMVNYLHREWFPEHYQEEVEDGIS